MTTPEAKHAEPKPGRRRFQFSLAGLLALTTVLSVVLSLLKWSPWFFGALFVDLGFWIVATYIDRRFSLRFSGRTLVAVIVTIVLLGLLLAVMRPAIR